MASRRRRTNLGAAANPPRRQASAVVVVVACVASFAGMWHLSHAWSPAPPGRCQQRWRHSSGTPLPNSWVVLHEAPSKAGELVVDLGDPTSLGIPAVDNDNDILDSNIAAEKEPVWNGEVVSNTPNGEIRGCTLQPVVPEAEKDGTGRGGRGAALPPTEWTVTIDGVQADLGRFSDAVYRKLVSDAKRQRFQGFRPGTLPPFLEPSYRIAAMDECARETVLEALQQNNVQPFESARSDMTFEQVSIPPPPGRSKNKARAKKPKGGASSDPVPPPPAEAAAAAANWRTFPSIGEAVSAGWRPGQSFSFVAKNVRGQKVSQSGGSGPMSSASVNGLVQQ